MLQITYYEKNNIQEGKSDGEWKDMKSVKIIHKSSQSFSLDLFISGVISFFECSKSNPSRLNGFVFVSFSIFLNTSIRWKKKKKKNNETKESNGNNNNNNLF